MAQIEAQKRLDAFVRRYRNQREAAKALGISQQYLNDILNGRRQFSDRVLDALGLEWGVVKKSA